ncbi:amp-binding enzyme [Cystoisospora suis]|uniref:Amp-binding enzyme n=1 Tax=Cystoisospora suis TaxID=483139 RepID=A0A2C6LEI8_9APIC|nr:amp-binding enzyme [Cystoisospora suis]
MENYQIKGKDSDSAFLKYWKKEENGLVSSPWLSRSQLSMLARAAATRLQQLLVTEGCPLNAQSGRGGHTDGQQAEQNHTEADVLQEALTGLGSPAVVGVRIAHYMTANRLEDVILRLASGFSGYIPVTINWTADPVDRVLYKILSASCRAVIVDNGVPQDVQHKLRDAAVTNGFLVVSASSLCGSVNEIFQPQTNPSDATAGCRLLSAGDLRLSVNESTGEDSTKEHGRLIVYTSGTTGLPKGVLLSNRNMGSSCRAFQSLLELNDKTALTVLIVNPLHHINSSVMLELAFRYPHARIHLISCYTTSYWKVLAEVSEEASAPSQPVSEGNQSLTTRRVVAPLVPRHVDFLQHLSASGTLPEGLTLERLKSSVSSKNVILLMGSAPVGPTTISTLNQLLGKLPLIRFGSTETCLQVLATPLGLTDTEMRQALEKGWRHEYRGVKQEGFYIGRPHMPMTEAKVVRSVDRDSESYMEECKEGEPGLLVSRGQNHMSGYVNAAANVFSEDKWYLGFGDVCFFLETKTARGTVRDYYWVTRTADIVMKGGANYSGAQISQDVKKCFLECYPEVDEAQVAVATVGLKVASEHEDSCCVTIELAPKEGQDGTPAWTALLSDVRDNFLTRSRQHASLPKASRPDFVRVARLARNFKGAVDVSSLKQEYMDYLDTR